MAMIVLHMGMPKTGTSALQRCLLYAAGQTDTRLRYPAAGRGGGIAHHDLVKNLATNGTATPDVAELLRELGDANDRPAIITSETFTNLITGRYLDTVVDFARRLPAHGDTRLVVTLRRLDKFHESMYLQSARHNTVDHNIENYIVQRFRWAERLMGCLNRLRQEFAEALVMPCHRSGFDSVDWMEAFMGLPAETLTVQKSRLRNTAKRSWKTQICVQFCEPVAERVGATLSRAQMLRVFDQGNVTFSADTMDYTIIPHDLARAVHLHALDSARRNGIGEYVDGFADDGWDPPPFRRMTIEALSPRDYRALETAIKGQAEPTIADAELGV